MRRTPRSISNPVPAASLIGRASPLLLCAAAVVTTTVLASTACAQNLAERVQGVAEAQQRQLADRNSSRSQIFGAMVYTDISVDFQETPARQALDYLRTQMGIDMVVRWSTDRNAVSGIDPEATVTLRVDGRPALLVLETILDQLTDFEPNTWQLRNGYLEVGPKDRLDAGRELRYYPVRDLLFEPTRFDNAPEFDLDAAINQGDQQGGGGGGGGGFGGGGGGGFGGGGGSGGGGGGGGSGGGGSIFGAPGEDPERISEAERVEQLIDLILELVEPERWVDAGGNSASIRYYQGVLIIRAPDYIHRQIGGYPFAARPRQTSSTARGGRYVTFSAPFSIIENVEFATTTVSGAAGGTASNP